MTRSNKQTTNTIRLTEITHLEYLPVVPTCAVPSPDDPKHKRFELCVAQMLQLLNPDKTVKHNAKLKGQSGVARQIDLSLGSANGVESVCTVVEAKALKRRIDIAYIDKLIGLREDVRIQNAMMVGYSGYTHGAIARALSGGVAVQTLIDTESTEWGTPVSIPAWCELTQIEEIHCTLSTPGARVHVDPSSAEFACFFLRHAGGRVRLYNLGRVIANALYESTIEFDVGRNDFEFLRGPLSLHDPNRPEVVYAAELSLSVTASKRVVYGDLPLSCARGFLDEQTGVVKANFQITRADLDLDSLIPDWQEGPAVDTCRPSFGIGAIGIAPDLLEEHQ